MKRMAGLAAVAVLVCAAGVSQALTKEYFSDDFNDNVRNKAKWAISPYMSNTAKLQETGGHVLMSRNAANTNASQYTEWDAKFVRTYNNSDYLAIMGTVRVPHKIKTGDAVYQMGIGFVEAASRFVELTVEDNAYGRYFSLYVYDGNTGYSDVFYYDAPQNVTVFDLAVEYSAKTDNVKLYWSVPGLNFLFLITPAFKMSAIGGSLPRSIQPYLVGYIFDGAAVPGFWNVNIDDFLVYREDAP